MASRSATLRGIFTPLGKYCFRGATLRLVAIKAPTKTLTWRPGKEAEMSGTRGLIASAARLKKLTLRSAEPIYWNFEIMPVVPFGGREPPTAKINLQRGKHPIR